MLAYYCYCLLLTCYCLLLITTTCTHPSGPTCPNPKPNMLACYCYCLLLTCY